MFVVTMKFNKQLFFVCCAMILALLGITISAVVSKPVAVSAAAMIVKNNEDRVSFLRSRDTTCAITAASGSNAGRIRLPTIRGVQTTRSLQTYTYMKTRSWRAM